MKTYNYVYLITNSTNGKIYVGQHQTDNLNDGYMGSGTLLRRAIQKHGIENFTKEYLAFADNKKALDFLERFYIKKFNAKNKSIGYNIQTGGGAFDGHRNYNPWNKGKKGIISEDVRRKMRLAKVNFVPWNKGKKGVQKNKYKGKKGIFSDATILKMKMSAKKRYEKNGPNITTLGFHWYNNGVKSVFCKECPEGYIKGRIIKSGIK